MHRLLAYNSASFLDRLVAFTPMVHYLMTPERWQQIERLLHAALTHNSTERAAFLDQACAGDLTLRQEVESLLAHEGLRKASSWQQP